MLLAIGEGAAPPFGGMPRLELIAKKLRDLLGRQRVVEVALRQDDTEPRPRALIIRHIGPRRQRCPRFRRPLLIKLL